MSDGELLAAWDELWQPPDPAPVEPPPPPEWARPRPFERPPVPDSSYDRRGKSGPWGHKLTAAEQARGAQTLNRRRAIRAQVKAQLRDGTLSLESLVGKVRMDGLVEDKAHDWAGELARRNPELVEPHVEWARTAARMPVADLLDALPRMGPHRTAQALRDLHIAADDTLGQLLLPAHMGGRWGAIEDLLHLEEVERAQGPWECPEYCSVCHRRRWSWRSAVVVDVRQGWRTVRRYPRVCQRKDARRGDTRAQSVSGSLAG
jgi:hypothetical protein